MNVYSAKGLVLQLKQDRVDSNISTVIDIIKDEIRKGRYQCSFSNSWIDFDYDSVISYFERLGYIVTRERTHISISWNI